MKNKLLVIVYVPLIEKELDVYIPIVKKVGTVKNLIIKDNSFACHKLTTL